MLVNQKKMTFRFTCLLFWMGLACTLLAQQSSKPEAVITISGPTEEIKAGADVYIKVQLTNISDREIDCSSYNVGPTNGRYRVVVLDEDGNSMAKKDIHPELMAGSLKMCTLAPGKSTGMEEERISWLNDISKPGKYEIQFSRVIANDEKNGTVWSNKITITVVP
jgi:hypothetical protein